MTSYYHPKSGAVREIGENEASRDIKTAALLRAGFKVGKPPALKPVVEEEAAPLPATEGEEADTGAQGPVLAKHASVFSNLQLPEGVTLEDLFATDDEGETMGELFEAEDLSMGQLREIAKSNDITIPFEVRSKEAVAAFLREELEALEEDDEDAEDDVDEDEDGDDDFEDGDEEDDEDFDDEGEGNGDDAETDE
jgi:hypothetical protein